MAGGTDRDRLGDVGRVGGARQPAGRPAGADRGHPRGQGVLQVVRCGVFSGLDQGDQRIERHRARFGDLGGGRPAATHGDHDRRQVAAGRPPRDLAGDRRLPGSLARAVDGQDGHTEGGRVRDGWVEPEVRSLVGHAEDERYGDQLHPFPVPEHGLVGEIQHDLGSPLGDGRAQTLRPVVRHGPDGHADVGKIAGKELLDPSHDERHDDLDPSRAGNLERPAGDRWVVLAVDQSDRAHRMVPVVPLSPLVVGGSVPP